MKKFTKGVLAGLCAVVGCSALAAVTMAPATVETPTAQAEASYTTKDIAMMGRVAGWYGNGNFELRLTLGYADWSGSSAQKSYVGEADLATALNKLGFFDKIKLGDKTLREWGCTACYDNWYKVNSGEPDYTLMIPLAMGAENMTAASEAGIGADTPFTILEGALIPSDAYLQGDTSATVYRAGCDYVTTNSDVAYGIYSTATTEVQSVKYVQGHDGVCGYFGVSLVGDDYLGNGSTLEVNQNYSYESKYSDKVLVNGEAGKTGSYGLFNLSSKGQGYFSFAMYATAEEMESITIPAGTQFPSRAMTDLREVNGNPVYIMYETQTDVTFYKQVDGSWAKPLVEKETSVESAFIEGDESGSFTFIKLATNDYPNDIDNWGGSSVREFLARTNFYTHVLIDGVPLGSTAEALLNVWGNKGVVAFRTSNGVNTKQITVLAGCQFPTYNAIANGENEVYVTTQDITFVKNADGVFVEGTPFDEELEAAKVEALAEIEAYKAGEVYFPEQSAERIAAVNTAKKSIQNAVSEALVATALSDAKATIDALKTKAATIEAAQAEIEAYMAQEGYYKEQEAAQRAAIVAEKTAAVANAETATAVAEIVASAKAEINALPAAWEKYETMDVAMWARVAGWHGNGNFEINFTLGYADWGKTAIGQKSYDGSLAALLKKLDLFNKVKLGNKTLAEWGCTACYDNIYWLNEDAPYYNLRIPFSMGKDNMAAATEAGIGHASPVTILEGALIPSYGYLTKTVDSEVYRAGADYVTSTSTKAYGFEATAKVEIESVKYVQGFDGTCGYFGISFVGDDYLGDGTTLDVSQSYYFDNKFSDCILVNGEAEKVGYYGLFNLGEAGVGYYAFQIFVSADELVSITIPAGTKFPTRAMTDLYAINSNPVYIMYEVAEEITLYKTADGYGSYAEYIIPEVENYKAGMFREAEEAQRLAIIAEAKAVILSADAKDAIDAAVAAAKAKIDVLKTAAQYADEELAGVKQAALATIAAYKADVVYLAEEAQAKADIIANANAMVAAATSEAEIQLAVDNAIAAIDLLATKEAIVDAAKAEVEAYKSDVEYFDEQAAEKASIVENALARIDVATSEANVNAIVAAAKADIDALKTKAEIEAEILAGHKANANKAVDDLKKTIDFDLYDDEAIVLINAIYANAKTAIETGATEEEILAAVEAFKAALAEVPQKGIDGEDGDVTTPGVEDEGTEDILDSIMGALPFGCSGVVGGLAYALVVLGAAIVVCKKKEN